jgi:hypothetical protein
MYPLPGFCISVDSKGSYSSCRRCLRGDNCNRFLFGLRWGKLRLKADAISALL